MESRSKAEYRNGKRAALTLACAALAGSVATACANVEAAGVSVYTHKAQANVSTTEAIRKAYPNAENIEMNNVAQDAGSNGLSFMTWELPNGEHCRIDTTTPEVRTHTATSFANHQTPTSPGVCVMPSPSASAGALGSFNQLATFS